MTLFAADAGTPATLPLAFATVLGAIGIYFLLPRPTGRKVAVGTFLVLAGFAIMATTIATSFGKPNLFNVESILFWFFSISAVFFGTVLVTQRNPGRGAMAFAFVIVSVCGLFLLLAAPFLMAATLIVYAGAIIVTFLFVLMLSHAGGPSDENDRSREPLIGSLAGFAFIGLILFGNLRVSEPKSIVPIPLLTSSEKQTIAGLVEKLNVASAATAGKSAADIVRASDDVRFDLALTLSRVEARYRLSDGTTTPAPLDEMQDRVHLVRDKIKLLENSITFPASEATKEQNNLITETRLLMGATELPARNVGSIGMLLYSEYLLAVEMAGTLLLVAAIGAVSIASRKAVPA